MKLPPPKSALNVMEGVEQPQQVNPDLVNRLKHRKPKRLTVDDYLAGIRKGNRMILSKAITLVESSLERDQQEAQEVIAACLKMKGEPGAGSAKNESYRIGITGVPGVGKSTFIEALGKYLTAKGHKLAVLAIDPSSTRSKGSILGDKTRMEELAVDPNAFIRPSPSAGSLGGVARKTRETIILCEAAGFDVIFIETVGVGQSETAVHSMVDFFLLLMLAGAGDELQGIKRGIIEMADAIFINKADGENLARATAAQAEYRNALHLFPPSSSGWIPTAGICSAKTKIGMDTIWKTILDHRRILSDSGFFYRKRMEQDRHTLSETIEEGLKHRFYSDPEIARQWNEIVKMIDQGLVNPYQAARSLLDIWFKDSVSVKERRDFPV
jgi:LAO/AO transport system kinase